MHGEIADLTGLTAAHQSHQVAELVLFPTTRPNLVVDPVRSKLEAIVEHYNHIRYAVTGDPSYTEGYLQAVAEIVGDIETVLGVNRSGRLED